MISDIECRRSQTSTPRRFNRKTHVRPYEEIGEEDEVFEARHTHTWTLVRNGRHKKRSKRVQSNVGVEVCRMHLGKAPGGGGLCDGL